MAPAAMRSSRKAVTASRVCARSSLCRLTWSVRARSGSSGRAQPCSWFQASLSGAYVRSHPGGAMFRALPVRSSIRGTRKCSSTRPPSGPPVCACRTQAMSYCSASIPANATRSNSSITARCCASVGASSRANEITPVV